MRLGNKLMRLCVFVGVFSAVGVAEENADTSTVAKSQININASSVARVFVDDDSVGTTPLVVQLSSGRHILRVIAESDVNNWASEPIADTVMVQPTTPLSLSYSFKKRIFLNSSPTGAEVFDKDSLLGTTPLFVTSNHGAYTFRKPGYEEGTITSLEPKNIHVELKRVWQSGADSSIFREAEEGRSSLRLYITGATTVIAGAASAYFKVKADNSYSSYLQSGNPSQLSDTDRYDKAAIIAITATQLGLGLFTYFILSE
jgi:hypothetical protein